MKEKGFTLIELLAVIVILSVIALITTPMIMGVIESSKKGAKESSASGYVGALEQYQVTAEILGKKVIPDTTLSTDDLKQYDIDVKGETPIDGYVTIKNKQVVDYKLQFDEYLVSYNSEKNKGEATKEKIKGDYTVYKEGEQVTIDGVSYHVIKNSSSYSDSVTLLRDESIGEMKFDDNGGTDFETSTLKTYLNSTYKDTFGDKKQYIKEITLIDFGADDNTKNAFVQDKIYGEININYDFAEGTYMYLYKKNYDWIINNWVTKDELNDDGTEIIKVGGYTWTKSIKSTESVVVDSNGVSKKGIIVGVVDLVFDGWKETIGVDVLIFGEQTDVYFLLNGYSGTRAIKNANVRPVIVIDKEAL